MISPSQRPLPDNTQHSQQTNIHAPGGIRTHNLSRRAAKDLRLRPRGHWDGPKVIITKVKKIQPLITKTDENFTKKKCIFTKLNVLVCSPVMKFGWNVKDYNGFISAVK